MNEHTGFHNKEHYSPDCLACRSKDGPDREKIAKICFGCEHLITEPSWEEASKRTLPTMRRAYVSADEIIALLPDNTAWWMDTLRQVTEAKDKEIEEARREEGERMRQVVEGVELADEDSVWDSMFATVSTLRVLLLHGGTPNDVKGITDALVETYKQAILKAMGMKKKPDAPPPPPPD